MKAKKILCPTDFSSWAKHALEIATALTRDSGGELIIVHVEEMPPPYSERNYGLGMPVRKDLQSLLLAEKPTDPSVPYEHRLLSGDVAAAIIDFARTEKVDLIVMGTHGRTGLSRVLMGSVAEAVVRRSPCPVLTIGKAVAVEAHGTASATQ